MRNWKWIVTILSAAIVLGRGGRAMADADAVSPLRLSMNLLETEPSAAKGRSVADGTTFRFRGYGIFSDGSGSVKWGDSVPGTISNLDFEDVLGMDMETFTGGFLIGLNLGSEGRIHLEASYDGFYDYEGDSTTGAISVDGEVFVGRITSELKLHAGLLNAGYDFLKMDRLTVRGDLGLRVFYVDASIREALLGREESITLIAPIPTVGLGARYDLTDNIYVKGAASGMYFGGLGSYVELSAEVGYDLNKNLGVFVGYRYWALEVNWEDTDLEVDIGGIYAGVEVRI